MTRYEKFDRESQDARRHDKQKAIHPDEKLHHLTKSKKNRNPERDKK